MENFFTLLETINNFYWGYIGWVVIFLTGAYLTIVSRGLQFRALFNFRSNIKEIMAQGGDASRDGIHPFKLFFASVGGMVGLGNIVGISLAMMIGGPGSIFWTVLAAFAGMLLKYSEIFLGVRHRQKNKKGGFDGGPMYYLRDAFKGKFLASFAAFLICLYGVETYQFTVLVDRIESTFEFNRMAVIVGLLILLIYSSIGGIKRLANICTTIMPAFMLIYMLAAIYIIVVNAGLLPEFFALVLKSAFTGQAQVGGFAGGSMVLAAYLGMSKAVYSGDIGIGYDSIVQSETRIVNPKMQATLAIYALFTDALICVITNTMIGVTGAWHSLNHLEGSGIVASIMSDYFPYSDVFMTLLLFFAGFTTLIAYLAAGIKCVNFLSPRYGRIFYLLYAIFAFIFACNFSQDDLILIMELLSGLLVLINVIGIIKLHREIEF